MVFECGSDACPLSLPVAVPGPPGTNRHRVKSTNAGNGALARPRGQAHAENARSSNSRSGAPPALVVFIVHQLSTINRYRPSSLRVPLPLPACHRASLDFILYWALEPREVHVVGCRHYAFAFVSRRVRPIALLAVPAADPLSRSIEVHPSEYYHIASWGADRPHSISAEMSPKLEYSIVLEADCPCNAHCQITLSTPHDRCNR
ncbi:hypothetical protein EV126DRAFT_431275 [Verticillium dahliae]|nr:hypothetical protein EV126DRAFT_431275 [Verticillium dahliae]